MGGDIVKELQMYTHRCASVCEGERDCCEVTGMATEIVLTQTQMGDSVSACNSSSSNISLYRQMSETSMCCE